MWAAYHEGIIPSYAFVNPANIPDLARELTGSFGVTKGRLPSKIIWELGVVDILFSRYVPEDSVLVGSDVEDAKEWVAMEEYADLEEYRERVERDLASTGVD
jgi:hypothetical protein